MTAASGRSLKIAIIRNAYAHDFGGGERMPVDLAAELIKLGHHPTVISRSGKLRAYAHEKNVTFVRGWWWSRQNWSGPRALLSPLYFAWQVLLTGWYLGLFLKLRPRVVHAQSRDDFIAATLAGRLLGKKIVWSDHADLKYVYQNLGIWYKNPTGKLVYLCSKLASTVIVTSHSDLTLLEYAAGRPLGPKYQVIYNGVVDQPELVAQPGESGKVVFACTSRLVTAKGIGELIAAFKILRTKFKDAELWLFGEGPQAAEFKHMAKGEPKIRFMGYPADTLVQLAKTDVLVHPSHMEGFSVSLVEAAMLGKPIIACRVGGNPELVSEGLNGLLVPARDEGALAVAMLRLANDEKLRQKMGRGSRKLYEQRFNLAHIVKEKYLPLYE